MRWNFKHKPSRIERLETWHVWFAWRPIKIGNYKYWLEFVWRKGTFNCTWADFWWTWEYKEHFWD